MARYYPPVAALDVNEKNDVLLTFCNTDDHPVPVAHFTGIVPGWVEALARDGYVLYRTYDITTIGYYIAVCVLSGLGVRDISPLQRCTQLVKLDAHDNEIESLPPSTVWSGMKKLQVLYLHQNRLQLLPDVLCLSGARALRVLTLYGNPVCLQQSYRNCLVNCLSCLQALDYHVVADVEVIPGLNASPPSLRFSARSRHLRHNLYLPPQTSLAKELKAVAGLLQSINDKLIPHSPILVIQRGWRRAQSRRSRQPQDNSAFLSSLMTRPTVRHPHKRSPADLFFPTLGVQDTLMGPKAEGRALMPVKLKPNQRPKTAPPDAKRLVELRRESEPRGVRKQLRALGLGHEADQAAHRNNPSKYQLKISFPTVQETRRLTYPFLQTTAIEEDIRELEKSQRKARVLEDQKALKERLLRGYQDQRQALTQLQDARREQEVCRVEDANRRVWNTRDAAEVHDSRRYRLACSTMPIRDLMRHAGAARAKSFAGTNTHSQPPHLLAAAGYPHERARFNAVEQDKATKRWRDEHKQRVQSAEDKRRQDRQEKSEKTISSRSNASCAAKIHSVGRSYEQNFACQMTSVIRAVERSRLHKKRQDRERSRAAAVQSHRDEVQGNREKVQAKRELENALITATGKAEKGVLEAYILERAEETEQQAQDKAATLRSEERQRAARIADSIKEGKKTAAPLHAAKTDVDGDMLDSTSQANLQADAFPARGIHLGNLAHGAVIVEYCGCSPRHQAVAKTE